MQRSPHWQNRIMGGIFFHVYRHNSFIFDRILKVKKTKFAENSALSITFWSKRASSSSLEAIIKWRRPGAAVEFCHHFSGRFPAKIDEECRPVEFFCLKWLYLDTMRGDESRKSQSDAWFFLVGSCYFNFGAVCSRISNGKPGVPF